MTRVVAALLVAAAIAAAAAVVGAAQPGGAEIVFVARSAHSGGRAVFAVHADGSSLRRLPVGKAAAVYLSPGGKRIATVGRTLTIRDLDGSHAVTVIACGGGCDVAWAPKGERLVYTVADRCGRSICPSSLGIVRANGKGRRTLLRFGGARVTSPSWAPDGSLIAFVESASGVADLDVVRPNGHGFTRLAPVDGSAYYPQYHPSWAPDSSALFFSARRSGAVRVLTVARDGSDLRMLAQGSFPVVAPDGKRVAFVRNGAAYTMPVDGGKQSKVASGVASVVAWSPGSDRLAFATAKKTIAVADAHGGGSRSLTNAYSTITTVTWRPL